ncbi:DUF4326 domain-containing protein [Actinoalloteichus sp. GBA129-24]|uniref:DUF4326 domain-containing protein n=1 Tax=Actinoalloteichus sp. GBA129-24 TaxID=1612551 RepID=UPI0009504791|nr:DUF4326 domain-containing protein [Actinoalloteichus sp. GBA129-24]APU20894.1 putative DUF4326 family protein [Actinoalloteichus sp. GBA129-24]APU24143.1 putative DUF4326 family protein [Actinoalloteichus sp. GBA129-24]
MTARRLTLTQLRADTAGAVDIDTALPSPFATWPWPRWSTSRPWAVGVAGDVPTVYGTTETESAAAAAAVQLYISWLAGSVVLDDLAKRRLDHLALIPVLAGRDLACRCALDVPCHGDALLVLASGVSPLVLLEDLREVAA